MLLSLLLNRLIDLCQLLQEFPFDFPGIDLEVFYCNLWKGIKKYILKDPAMETDTKTGSQPSTEKRQVKVKSSG